VPANRVFCCRIRRKRPPACVRPALIPHANPRTTPAVAGNPRTPQRRPKEPEVVSRET
jgi:hypothetical protein